MAWVNRKGEMIFTAWGWHEKTPLVFFGQTVQKFEKKWARITETTKTVEDAIEYVRRPTVAQKRAVMNALARRGRA